MSNWTYSTLKKIYVNYINKQGTTAIEWNTNNSKNNFLNLNDFQLLQ